MNLLGNYFPLSSVQGLAKGYQSLHQRGLDTSKLTKVKLRVCKADRDISNILDKSLPSKSDNNFNGYGQLL